MTILLGGAGITLYLLSGRGLPKPAPIAPAGKGHFVLSNRSSITNFVGPIGPTFRWANLESDDYRKYVANLRNVGCPRETVVDIVVADVNKVYRLKAKLMHGEAASIKEDYWRPHKTNAKALQRETEKREQIFALDKERRRVLKDLLGTDISEDILDRDSLMREFSEPEQRGLSFLSPAKQAAIKEMQSEMGMEIRRRIKPGPINSENLAEIRRMRGELDAKLTEILTPSEKREYDLRTSVTAQHLRQNLANFNPTEAEFTAMFDVQKAFDKQSPASGQPHTSEEITSRFEAETRLNAQMRQALGEERYSDYQRVMDPAYRLVAMFGDGQDIPEEKVRGVYEVQKQTESQANLLRRDESVPTESKQDALQKLRAEAANELKSVLGAENYEAYSRSDASSWINRVGSLEVKGPTRVTSSTVLQLR